MAFFGRRVDYLARLIFPPRCAACRKMLPWRTPTDPPPGALCEACEKIWTSETRETCGICTSPVTQCTCMPEAMQKAGCEAFCKLVYYDPKRRSSVQNRMIYRIKNDGSPRTVLHFAEALSSSVERLLAQCEITKTDAVIAYLPRSRAARLAHGTDQARAMARALSHITGVPMQPLFTRSSGHARAQKRLTLAMRVENAGHAYVMRKGATCKGKAVILVDDVVTTGASMAACARIAKRMGASHVFAVAAAADAFQKDPINKKFTENRVFF